MTNANEIIEVNFYASTHRTGSDSQFSEGEEMTRGEVEAAAVEWAINWECEYVSAFESGVPQENLAGAWIDGMPHLND